MFAYNMSKEEAAELIYYFKFDKAHACARRGRGWGVVGVDRGSGADGGRGVERGGRWGGCVGREKRTPR